MTRRPLPDFVSSAFGKDIMSAQMLPNAYGPGEWLHTGKKPQVGQKIYIQAMFKKPCEDISSGKNWARLIGHVVSIEPRPPNFYKDGNEEEPTIENFPLSEFKNEMTQQVIIGHFGAMHGQKIQLKVKLSCDDEGKIPMLEGEWDATFICNDNLENMWVWYN